MTTTSSLYSSTHNQQQRHQNDDDRLFLDTQIQRYDADTIKHRYGDNWKTFASNVREIKQPDGSILKEYIIEDPSLLEEMKPPPTDTTSSTTGSDDEQQQQQQQSGKHKFAQIKAKFERKTLPNVMASPSSSSVTSSSTATTSRQIQNSKIDDLYARHRRASNESITMPRTNLDGPANGIAAKPKTTPSYRRLDSADEAADEEVQRIHRQGEELRRHQHDISPAVSSNPQTNIQYEIVDEDGNPMMVDGVHDLIKMSGVHAKEIRQPDGTIVKEYVIDDPELLSKIRTQHPQTSASSTTTMIPSYSHPDDNVPPPPPRIPLRQPMLYRQIPSSNDNNVFLSSQPVNIQQIRALEPQRRYEFMTTSGRRIEFVITNAGADGMMMSDADIRELSHNINTRLIPSGQQQRAPPPFVLPKQWYPAVDLTHREPPPPPQVIPQQHRQRIGSDTQAFLTNYQLGYQQVPPGQGDLPRSSSYGTLNQGSYVSRPYPSSNLPPQQQQQQQFAPMVAEPIIDWSALRQQDPHGQIDPAIVQQIIAQQQQQRQHQSPPVQRHQDNVGIQSSAQFLPQQPARPTNSSPSATGPVFYQQQQQSAPYPYQGQQQHGVRILSSNDFDLMQQQQQQRSAVFANGHTRI